MPVQVKPGYKPQASDTSVETDAFEFELLRRRSNVERLQMTSAFIRSARTLSLCGLRRMASTIPLNQRVAVAFLGDDYPVGFYPVGDEMTWIQDSIGLAAQLHSIFEDLNILYYVTGGVASTAYGEPRTTRDVDIVIAVSQADIERIVKRLESEKFYVPGVEDVKAGRMKTLGITHTETISRADLIVAGNEAFDHEKFARRQRFTLSEDQEFYLASPEDVILNKLRWRTQSDSEKQWRDVLGVLKVQQETLDYEYLSRWAEALQLQDALSRACTEAGIDFGRNQP